MVTTDWPVVIYTGRIDIINGTVSQVTGIEPAAAITTFNKVSYPIDVDIYSGGKFDLGSLLASIPGRLLRGVSGLVSGLLESEEQQDTSGEQSKELSLEVLGSCDLVDVTDARESCPACTHGCRRSRTCPESCWSLVDVLSTGELMDACAH
jgi:hypothetical protein